MNFALFFQNYKFVLLFYAVMILIVFLNRKKFQFQGKIIALYRTKVGLGLMDRMAEKYRNLIQLLGFCSVGIAYIGLVYVSFLLIKLFWIWKIGIGGFGLSKVYLFLYLCMLEILPLIVFSKVAFY